MKTAVPLPRSVDFSRPVFLILFLCILGNVLTMGLIPFARLLNLTLCRSRTRAVWCVSRVQLLPCRTNVEGGTNSEGQGVEVLKAKSQEKPVPSE